MNKEQLTEKLNERFAEELSYEPKFKIKDITTSIYSEFSVVTMIWMKRRIEYFEVKVIADYTQDNPFIEIWNDHIELMFAIKAQN